MSQRRAIRRRVTCWFAASWPVVLTLALPLAVVYWAAGRTFGYTIFVIFWTPIAAVCTGDSLRVARFGIPSRVFTGENTAWNTKPCHPESCLHPVAAEAQCSTWNIALLAVSLACLPWWLTEPAAVAGRWTTLLAAGTVAVAGLAVGSGRLRLPSSLVRTVAVTLWLTWAALPLTRADALSAAVGDVRTMQVLNANPILAANAASDTAADWTHMAVAYKWLTPLGQDVAFDWPTSVWPSAAGHAGFGVAMWTLGRVWSWTFNPRASQSLAVRDRKRQSHRLMIF